MTMPATESFSPPLRIRCAFAAALGLLALACGPAVRIEPEPKRETTADAGVASAVEPGGKVKRKKDKNKTKKGEDVIRVTTSPAPNGMQLVHHAGGDTLIPARPRRIAALTGVDELLLLGIRPCAFPTSWDVVRSYEREGTRGSTPLTTLYGALDPPLEALFDTRPDVIFTSGNLAQVDRLSPIAPVVVFTWPGGNGADDIADRVREVAAVAGVPERAEPVIAAYEAKLAESRALLRQRLPRGETVAILRVRQKRYWVFGTWLGDLLYDPEAGLGLTPAPFVRERLLANDENQMLVDPELLPLIDADHLFVILDPMTNTDRQTAALEEVPHWGDVPAVKKGNVYYVSQSNWLTGGILVRSVQVDEMVSALLHEGRFATPDPTPDSRRAAIDAMFKDRDAVIRKSLLPDKFEGCE